MNVPKIKYPSCIDTLSQPGSSLNDRVSKPSSWANRSRGDEATETEPATGSDSSDQLTVR